MKNKTHHFGLVRVFPSSVALFAALAILTSSGATPAQGQLLLANPHWNITLSDFGYSDFLLDNTPGFEGREYLSGEWGAAVGYQVVGGATVAPQWLEPQFYYPDWMTDSSFGVVTPLTEIGLNVDGLPIAQSVITNSHLEITLRHEMIDSVVGIAMGATAASASGSGAFVNSDRYLLQQTCTIKNISGSDISNVQLFQFLHGYWSQRGVFDNRLYTGPTNDFRYDVTLAGVDLWSAGASSSTAGLEDFIAFHSSAAPSGYEIGHYGIEGNGVDDHVTGKPSDGVHLSIEDNWQHDPYLSRLGVDYFAPPERWVAGAQRWEFGTLAAGQSVSFDVILSLLTGTKVTTGTGSSGGCIGGSSVPGGVDYQFEDVTSEGSCFGEYSRADANEVEVRISENEFDPIDFHTPGGPVQLWELEFNGTYSGAIQLTFAYDPTILPAGFDETTLAIHQFIGNAWRLLTGTVDPLRHIISVSTDTLSVFVLGADSRTTTDFKVDASVAPANSGTVTGTGRYTDGSSVTLVATASTGYVFENWAENGALVSASPSFTFVVTGDRTLVANFVASGTGQSITTSSQPSNGGATSGDGVYALGATATVNAIPNAGYKFSKWLENGIEVSASASYSFTVTGNRAFVAKFKPVYTITTRAEPPEGGEIDANDDKFEFGDLAVLKAKPNPDYCFVNWTQNGTEVSAETNYQFTVTGNRDLVANFALGNRITTAKDPLNAGTTSGDGIYETGTSATVEASADAGYAFVNWTENGVPVSSDAIYTFTVTASRTLVANFTSGYTVTTSGSPSDGGTATGGGNYPNGASVTVTAVPHTGYAFMNWTEGGVEVSASASYSFSAGANRVLVAHFTPILYTVTTSSAPPEGGTTTGGNTYQSGANVTVIATPNAGYAFVNWMENGGEVSASASYSFTASANRSLVANFMPVYAIATGASPSAGGTTTGDGDYAGGANVTVMATPNAGYAFVNWTEGGVQVSTSASYSFTASANRTLVANFMTVYTIATSASPSAGGTTTGDGNYPGGANVTVTATPSAGYTFVKWTEKGKRVSTAASYSFTANANRTLVAEFKRQHGPK